MDGFQLNYMHLSSTGLKASFVNGDEYKSRKNKQAESIKKGMKILYLSFLFNIKIIKEKDNGK